MALGSFSSLELWRLGPLSSGLVALFIVCFLHTWHVEAVIFILCHDGINVCLKSA